MSKYQEAVDAGYSDQEIAGFLAEKSGFGEDKLREAANNGYSYKEMAQFLERSAPAFAVKASTEGLTGVLNNVKDTLTQTVPNESSWGETLSAIPGQIGRGMMKAGAGIVQAVEENTPLGLVGEANRLGKPAYHYWDVQEKINQPNVSPTSIKGIVSSAAGMAGQMIPLAPSLAVAPEAVPLIFGAQSGGDIYGRLRAENVAPSTALPAAGVSAAAMTLASKTPIGILLDKDLPMVKRMVQESLASAGIIGGGTGTVDQIINKLTANPGLTFSEAMNNIAQGLPGMALGGLALGAMAHPLSSRERPSLKPNPTRDEFQSEMSRQEPKPTPIETRPEPETPQNTTQNEPVTATSEPSKTKIPQAEPRVGMERPPQYKPPADNFVSPEDIAHTPEESRLIEQMHRDMSGEAPDPVQSPFALIRKAGGIDPRDPNAEDLRVQLGMEKGGYGGLFRKGGMTMDKARELIDTELGSSKNLADINDFIAHMEEAQTQGLETQLNAKESASGWQRAETEANIKAFRESIAEDWGVSPDQVSDLDLAKRWQSERQNIDAGIPFSKRPVIPASMSLSRMAERIRESAKSFKPGENPEMNIAGDVEKVAHVVSQIEKSGGTVDDYLRQKPMFGDELSGKERRMLELHAQGKLLPQLQEHIAQMVERGNRQEGIFVSGNVKPQDLGKPEDFVKTPDGSLDFGRIHDDAANAIGSIAGPIRLQKGNDLWGETKIEAKHGPAIRKYGFADTADFVRYVASNYNSIHEGDNGRVLLAVRNGRDMIAAVELKKETGNYYSVTTAFPSKQGYLNARKQLWSGTATSTTEPGSSSSRSSPSFLKPGKEGLGASSPNVSSDLNIPPSRPADKTQGSLGMTEGPQEDIKFSRQPGSGPGVNYGRANDIGSTPEEARKAVQEVKEKPEIASAKPLRRDEILKPLAQALGLNFYERRIRGKGVMGRFNVKTEEIRTKYHQDLYTVAHEVAHYLDKKFPEISRQWKKNPTVREELNSLSYDSSKTDEGFAEYLSAWTAKPDVAAKFAPTFDKWFNSYVSTLPSKQRMGIDIMRDKMRAWWEQPALVRLASKIGKGEEPSTTFKEKINSMRQGVFDNLQGIMNAEHVLTGTKEGPVYQTARLMRNVDVIMEGVSKWGIPTVAKDGELGWRGVGQKGSEFKPHGLEHIFEGIAKEEQLDAWSRYAVARSADELMKQGREFRFTRAEIKAGLALGDKSIYPEHAEAFQKAFQEYQELNTGVLDFAEAMGVINPQQRAFWKRNEYLSMYAIEELSKKDGGSGMGNFSGVKELKGGTDQLKNTFDNITGNMKWLISGAVQNKAKLEIRDLMLNSEGSAKFMAPIPAESKRIRVDNGELIEKAAQAILGEGADPRAVTKLKWDLEKEFGELWVHGQAPEGDNIWSVRVDGKPEYWEVADPVLLRSLMSFSPGKVAHWAVDAMSIPKKILQKAVTHNPAFPIANFAKDQPTAAIMSKYGYVPILDAIRGMKSVITQDADYRDYVINGGGMGGLFLGDAGQYQKHLEHMFDQRGVDMKTVINTLSKLNWSYEQIGNALEQGTRLGEYKRAISHGKTKKEAAFAAREVSTDFSMKGDSEILQFFANTVPFFNPAIVGVDRLYRGLTRDANRGAKLAKIGMLVTASMVLSALNRGRPEYDDLPDWDKDGNWHVFIPQSDGKALHLRYPKIWEIGGVASIAERTMQRLLDGAPENLAGDYARIICDVVGINPIPQVIKPLVEQWSNRVFFTGRPIETQHMQNLPWHLRGGDYTSPTLKAVTEGAERRNIPLNIGPARFEALLRGYFGAFAQYALMGMDSFSGKESMRKDQWPIVSRFYSNDHPMKGTRHESEFHEVAREIKETMAAIKTLAEDGRPEDAAREANKHMDALRKKDAVDSVSETLRDISKAMHQIRINSKLSGEEKRSKIDELQGIKNTLFKSAMKGGGK